MIKKTENVVITGLGCVSPLGLSKENIKNNLFNNIAGNIENGLYKVPPKERRDIIKEVNSGEISIDFAVKSFQLALKDANLQTNDFDKDCFIVYSSSKGGMRSFVKACLEKKNKYINLLNFLPCSPLNYICKTIGKNIPAQNVVSACSTGLYSIINAYLAVQEGARIAVAGTTESSVIPIAVNAFKNMGALTKKEFMPFDINRSGFLMGEGAGCLILENEKHAKKRKAHVYAKIESFSRLTDPTHITGLNPDGVQIYKAIANTLNGFKDIDWINAHGTGTKLNDKAEYNAFIKYFKNVIHNIPVVSLKPYIGHLLGASSTVETIMAIYCMEENIIPANLNLKHPDFNLNLPTNNVKKELNNVLKLSHGFGGHIGVLHLKK